MRTVVKSVIFLLLTGVFLMFLGDLMREKNVKEGKKEPITDWLEEYAELPANVVDVLFLGSSQSFCSVNPLIVYKESGIVSYGLGSSAQDIYATKAYLEYGLKSQTPKVVFLECRNLIIQGLAEERWNRVAYDNLPFSLYKYRNLAHSIRPEESLLSYVFPVLRFHERWKDLSVLDFSYVFPNEYGSIEEYSYKGYYPRYTQTKVDLSNFYDDRADYILPKRSKVAVEEIKKLCDDAGAELVLWKSPSPMWRESYAKEIQKLAGEFGITYIDMNYLYEELGLDIQRDFLDSDSHLNDAGALKVSTYLAEYLREQGLPDHRGEEIYSDYETDYSYYFAEAVAGTRDILSYLNKIKEGKCQIYIVLGGGLKGPSWPIRKALENLGLEEDFANMQEKNYIAVLDNGKLVLELIGTEEIKEKMEISGHTIELSSAKTSQSILFDGEEMLCQDKNGLGFVLYDSSLDKVIDSIVFDINNHSMPYR